MIVDIQKLTVGCLGCDRYNGPQQVLFSFLPDHPAVEGTRSRTTAATLSCVTGVNVAGTVAVPSQARTGKAEDSLAHCLWVPE